VNQLGRGKQRQCESIGGVGSRGSSVNQLGAWEAARGSLNPVEAWEAVRGSASQ
jgi:hypothetical protein